MSTLSIIIPAYNEERFIGALLEKVLAVDLSEFGMDRQVIVIDDCSTDRTAEIASRVAGVDLIRREKNGGKGEAVKSGLQAATGDFIVIQDADLEYEPDDYRPMLRALFAEGSDVVYGSRYLKTRDATGLTSLWAGRHWGQSLAAYAGGRSLSLVGALFTGRYLSDTVTALKLFKREVIRPLSLETGGFELDHEISAKVLAAGRSIVEVPIRYYPRSRNEGKKIGLRDWFKAIQTFARYRKG
jgi:glycosyltransferase involved in cell wall biosynthesis